MEDIELLLYLPSLITKTCPKSKKYCNLHLFCVSLVSTGTHNWLLANVNGVPQTLHIIHSHLLPPQGHSLGDEMSNRRDRAAGAAAGNAKRYHQQHAGVWYGAHVGGSKTFKRNILRVFTMTDLLNI